MSTITVSLPNNLHAFALRRVQEMHFDSVEEYVESLIACDQNSAILDPPNLEEALLEGLKSKPVQLESDYWQRRALAMRNNGRVDE